MNNLRTATFSTVNDVLNYIAIRKDQAYRLASRNRAINPLRDRYTARFKELVRLGRSIADPQARNDVQILLRHQTPGYCVIRAYIDLRLTTYLNSQKATRRVLGYAANRQAGPDIYDINGYNIDTGLDFFGYDENGYDADGYDEYGYDENGYNADGYNADGYDENGYDADGYNADGYDADGYDEYGYDSDGYNANGESRNRVRTGRTDPDNEIDFNFFGQPADDIYYGLEIEAEINGLSSDISDQFRDVETVAAVVSDCSLLDDKGLEIISHPMSYTIAQEHIKKVCRLLREHEASAHDCNRAGMHINISRKPFADLATRILRHFVNTSRLLDVCSRREIYRHCNRDQSITDRLSWTKTSAVSVYVDRIEVRLCRSSTKTQSLLDFLELTRSCAQYALQIAEYAPEFIQNVTDLRDFGTVRYANIVRAMCDALPIDQYLSAQHPDLADKWGFKSVAHNETGTAEAYNPMPLELREMILDAANGQAYTCDNHDIDF